MAKEARIQARIRLALEAAGARVIKIHGDIYMEPGIADLIACLHGRYIAIEVKRPGEGPTERQSRFLAEVRAAGGIAAVVSDPQVVVRALAAFPHICRVCLSPLVAQRCPHGHEELTDDNE